MSGSEDARASGRHRPSLSARTERLARELVAEAELLGLGVRRSACGATLVDAGIAAPGSLEAGRRIAELCMGGAGWVGFSTETRFPGVPFRVEVRSADPVLACLLSQYAGWSLAWGEGENRFRAMASGPGRARAAKEPLFAELGFRDRDAESAWFVLETAREPPEGLIEKVAADCALPPSALGFVLAPTTSLAGTVQIVARVLEVALHKAHVLGFPLARLVDGLGSAPLPPPAPDLLSAMGRTNDAVLFGGEVELFVSGPEEEAAELARALPSSASRDYGRPFAELFAEAGYDFYKIDPMLFSPARVTVVALATGRSFTAGTLAPELLARSFGL
ncbi:MAG: methenyltetrahydromethanopterin cyclohydrolase [Geminicoccaceae bacterium]|nr:methenyltetrahydromethanopterin cyclohydrolase [Geminicoccaceae bacterium]MDW8444069.1 methenyltetrahydromethanopterin cyclohydrolase [Acetobacteraceae bacterium]MCS7268148.1 methenyltetrahydromethanopterin cyclohydrolase [Geminicoccaceae bacterium]MCX7629614.1 methenyltetrahydromethanopterin cyclohydrolase [Geminicoccaceae bacterium]MDW8125387.1 methenyltetrahydromethanopterin cyclohydrolase [Geminicoccaceae bacterium]